MFPPKNETEQRKPATLTDKGKEIQKAELSSAPHGTCWANWGHGNTLGWGSGPGQLGAVGL